jgi:hypothetical protein
MAALLLVTACSGGGSGTPAPISSPGNGGSAQSDTAIAITNSFGTPVKTLSSYDASVNSPGGSGAASRAHRSGLTSGSCLAGVEFYAPDKNGDPNSTELEYFYDSACTEMARDAVRIYTSTGANSETVARTVSLYALGNSSAIATRADTETISNATFDSYGYPIVTSGFDRSDTSQLTIGGSLTIASGDELVMSPGTSSNTYCGDSAGYNSTGFAKLGLTFGWQGIASNGSRTVNGDGSVTWGATHAGTSSQGAIGALSIATGTESTACPIATPMFALAGGTQDGTYDIPVSATFLYGVLTNLTVTGATLSNGNTLTVSTTPGVLPTSSSFIQGTIANGTKQIATFSLDCFGDGILTVSGTGAQYAVTDWHVVH